MTKLPAYQWYPGDWRKDPGVQCLTYEERGVWRELLDFMHESEVRGKLMLGGRSMTDEEIASMLRIDLAKFKQISSKLLHVNVASRCECHGALMCRRMFRDDHLRRVRAEAGRSGGLRKAGKSPSKRLAKPTPSSSSSVSTSTSEQKQTRGEGVAKAVVGSNGYSLEQYFGTFYLAYPRKVGKPAALRSWRGTFNATPESKWSSLFATIMQSLAEYKRCEQWTKHDGKFVPYPATWLNQRRWEDEVPGKGRVRGAEQGDSFKGIEDACTVRTDADEGGDAREDRRRDEAAPVGRLPRADLLSAMSGLLEKPEGDRPERENAGDVRRGDVPKDVGSSTG